MHTNCHKLKTLGKEREFYKIFRKIRKNYGKEGLSKEFTNLKTILKVQEEGGFELITNNKNQKSVLEKIIDKVNYLIKLNK